MDGDSYIIPLDVGDVSRDGHGHSNTFIVKSSISEGDLKRAYQSGSRKVGFNLSEQVCSEFEDNHISEAQYNKLKSLGFKKKLEEDDGDICVYPADFVEMYLFIAKLGNDELQYKVLCNGRHTNIGGYGLYSQ